LEKRHPVCRRHRDSSYSRVWRSASPVTAPESGTADLSPFFFPDGRRFLYSVAAGGGMVGRAIYLGALDSSEPTKLRDGGSLPAYMDGFLLFVVDDTLMAQRFDADRLETTGETIPMADEIQVTGGPAGSGSFAVSQTRVLVYQTGINEKSTLSWFDRSGKEPGTLSGPRGFGYGHLTPDEGFAVVRPTTPPTTSPRCSRRRATAWCLRQVEAGAQDLTCTKSH
jgi:hypothetical protein